MFELPPVHTRRFEALAKSDLDADAYYIFAADSTEPRGYMPVWQDVISTRPDQCICVLEQKQDEVLCREGTGSTKWLSLLDDVLLARFVNDRSIYLDISGLAHHVWTPLLRLSLAFAKTVRVVYAEPVTYRPHPSPASPALFDLSSAYGGIAPLPGMARLSGPPLETKTILVAFLGFEGNRAKHVALSLDPVPRIVAVVGVPGFRMEYPAFTVTSNRDFLAEHGAYSNIRWARASCPFAAYNALHELTIDYPDHYLYIAPVGTKPHALGAVAFAIANPDSSELIYDHPVRKPGRTDGIGISHVYQFK